MSRASPAMSSATPVITVVHVEAATLRNPVRLGADLISTDGMLLHPSYVVLESAATVVHATSASPTPRRNEFDTVSDAPVSTASRPAGDVVGPPSTARSFKVDAAVIGDGRFLMPPCSADSVASTGPRRPTDIADVVSASFQCSLDSYWDELGPAVATSPVLHEVLVAFGGHTERVSQAGILAGFDSAEPDRASSPTLQHASSLSWASGIFDASAASGAFESPPPTSRTAAVASQSSVPAGAAQQPRLLNLSSRSLFGSTAQPFSGAFTQRAREVIAAHGKGKLLTRPQGGSLLAAVDGASSFLFVQCAELYRDHVIDLLSSTEDPSRTRQGIDDAVKNIQHTAVLRHSAVDEGAAVRPRLCRVDQSTYLENVTALPVISAMDLGRIIHRSALRRRGDPRFSHLVVHLTLGDASTASKRTVSGGRVLLAAFDLGILSDVDSTQLLPALSASQSTVNRSFRALRRVIATLSEPPSPADAHPQSRASPVASPSDTSPPRPMPPSPSPPLPSAPFVPLRDSHLTLALGDAVMKASHITVIAAVSGRPEDAVQTLRALDFLAEWKQLRPTATSAQGPVAAAVAFDVDRWLDKVTFWRQRWLEESASLPNQSLDLAIRRKAQFTDILCKIASDRHAKVQRLQLASLEAQEGVARSRLMLEEKVAAMAGIRLRHHELRRMEAADRLSSSLAEHRQRRAALGEGDRCDDEPDPTGDHDDDRDGVSLAWAVKDTVARSRRRRRRLQCVLAAGELLAADIHTQEARVRVLRDRVAHDDDVNHAIQQRRNDVHTLHERASSLSSEYEQLLRSAQRQLIASQEERFAHELLLLEESFDRGDLARRCQADLDVIARPKWTDEERQRLAAAAHDLERAVVELAAAEDDVNATLERHALLHRHTTEADARLARAAAAVNDAAREEAHWKSACESAESALRQAEVDARAAQADLRRETSALDAEQDALTGALSVASAKRLELADASHEVRHRCLPDASPRVFQPRKFDQPLATGLVSSSHKRKPRPLRPVAAADKTVIASLQ